MDPLQPAAPPPTTPQPEFTPAQNQTIGELGNAMQWVAAPLLVLGGLYAALTLLTLIQAFRDPHSLVAIIYIGLIAALFVALGRWLTRAGDSFRQIVTTTGQDLSHLMQALDDLRKLFSVLAVFVKIYVAIVIVTLIAALVALFLGPARV